MANRSSVGSDKLSKLPGDNYRLSGMLQDLYRTMSSPAQLPPHEGATALADPVSYQRRPAVRAIMDKAHRIYDIQSGSARLHPMEGLRGLAVLMVFFVHSDALLGVYCQDTPALQGASRFLGIVGNGGVDLFFILSGYLIYGALISNRATLLQFLGRRVQRIYPTFLAVFAIYLALSVILPDTSKLHGNTWPGAATYIVQNLLLLPGVFPIVPIITVSWSLSYELFFYVSAAVLIGATRMWSWNSRLRALLFVLVWCLYCAYCFSVPRAHARALMFVIGILLYEALASKAFRNLLSTWGERGAIILFAGAIGVSYVISLQGSALSRLPGWSAGRDLASGIMVYQGPYKMAALSIGMFWCAVYCLAFDGRLRRFFSWTPLRYLGNMSYSYYLIHGVTLQGLALLWSWLAFRGVAPLLLFVIGVPIGFAVTWVTSTVLFVMIEKPFSLNRTSQRRKGEMICLN
jgi:exopolysaccharide production protein ExoZ